MVSPSQSNFLKKSADICTLMRKLLKKKRVALNQFQKLAGKLQHASLEILSGRSLFTPLDMAMRNDPDFIAIGETLRQCLEDWRCLVQCMARKPNSVRLLVMCPLMYISYTDACKLGAGGVWCSGTTWLKPFLWQVEWPKEIQDSLVNVENPIGSVTINHLVLAGPLLGFLFLEKYWRGTPYFSTAKKPNNAPANSNSFMVTDPFGFSTVTRLSWMSFGHSTCQRNGFN